MTRHDDEQTHMHHVPFRTYIDQAHVLHQKNLAKKIHKKKNEENNTSMAICTDFLYSDHRCGFFLKIFDRVTLHDGAGIWVLIAEHKGVAVIHRSLFNGGSVGNAPHHIRRCLLVICLRNIRMSHQCVWNIRP